MIELGLQQRSSPDSGNLVSVLRPVIDRALEVLSEAIQAGDETTVRQQALSEIGRCRELFLEESEPERIQVASQLLFQTCESTLRSFAEQRSSRQSEINALIALVREAVATIAGSNQTFDSSLDQTTARFEAMAQCNDLHQLKERLAIEVTTLKKIAVERQQGWQKTVSVFEGRVAELEQQLVVTRKEASLDPLTRIANRRTFDRMCRDWLDSGRSQFVVALIDLDDFKRINDTHGHSVGDKVLMAVAQALKTSVRSSDLVARFGGDEFGVLASGVTLRQAEGRLKAVTAQLAKASVIPGEDQGITVSCGIAEYSAGDTVDSLLHRADQALYDSKRHGKNRVSVKTQAFIRDLLGK
jgi:diguanylate cyclase (GGDEF)-like protein